MPKNEPTVTGAIPLRERRSLAEEWTEFDRLILPLAASPLQRREMKRAFYSGAQSMFNLMTGGLDADSEPTDLDVAYVESLSEEIQAFARDVEKGRA